MNRRFALARVLLTAACGLLLSSTARAASLQPVNDWDATGVPSTVSMYIYVPDNLAANPPILVLAHYCGGTASAVFGQAQGGGIVAAADQYGFIMVVPQAANSDGSGRCWDVGSAQALSRDGGGDTEAIVRMVDYTLSQYDANAARVYVTGDSSGGMMTEALLALYPDVFTAGAAFAGVPAGCWAVSNPDGSWSGPCAGGSVTHTPAEWGDIVAAMYPGYTGRHPRVQLFHGDADDTISYTNHGEAIKEWTAVLGLSETPTSTETVQLGSHQATRQSWQNSCGYVVLDAFTSMGGNHGPSDALFQADYVIPFLGLDQTGPVDPEIEQCDDSGADSTTGNGVTTTGGMTSSGGAVSSSSTASSNSATTSTSSTSGSGGDGGTPSSSSTSATTGGTGGVGPGGVTTGGVTAASSGGGNTSVVTSAATTSGLGDTGMAAPVDEGTVGSDDGGCGCRAAGQQPRSVPLGIYVLLGLALLPVRRRGMARRQSRLP